MNGAWIGFLGVILGSIITIGSTIGVEIWRDRKSRLRATREHEKLVLLDLLASATRMVTLTLDATALSAQGQATYGTQMEYLKEKTRSFAILGQVASLKAIADFEALIAACNLVDQVLDRDPATIAKYQSNPEAISTQVADRLRTLTETVGSTIRGFADGKSVG